jgi:cbb3-type cytochrome c oxidase subunit III
VGHLRTISLGRGAVLLLTVAGLLLLAGCREDMHNQPKFIPLRENSFYPDGRSARPVLEGTIARGQLEDDPLLYTGKINGQEIDQFPFPIMAQDLARGRERFAIYCSPCHSLLGDGNGMIVQRGFKRPPSYFEARLLKAPVGHFFNVMTNGWGAMPDYSAQVPVADRWRIAAYIRALQLSRTAKLGDLPPGEKLGGEKQVGAVSTEESQYQPEQPNYGVAGDPLEDRGEELLGDDSAERAIAHSGGAAR